MNINEVKQRAKEMHESLGGRIFAFPIEEDNSHSKYAVTYYTYSEYLTYPNPLSISEVAMAILTTIEELNKDGNHIDYDNDVRFVSYDAQVNAPDITMRKLRNSGHLVQSQEKLLKEGKDVFLKDGTEEEYYLSAIGTLKMIYLTFIDDNNPKAKELLNEYYKILALNRYGKTAAAIKQEVRKMNRVQGVKWIESTYKKYIKDDYTILNLLNN